MGFFDFLKSDKVDNKTKLAFNYYFFFQFLPKALLQWKNGDIDFDSILSFQSAYIEKPEFSALLKQVKPFSSGIKGNPSITLYAIRTPAVDYPTAVEVAIVCVNKEINNYLYFTLEKSFGGYAICEPKSNGEHSNTGIIVKDTDEFLAFCIQKAKEHLTDLACAVVHEFHQLLDNSKSELLVAFNLYFYNDYIPRIIDDYNWKRYGLAIDYAISTEYIKKEVLKEHPEFSEIVEQITVKSTRLKKNNEIQVYLIEAPYISIPTATVAAMIYLDIPIIAARYYKFNIAVNGYEAIMQNSPAESVNIGEIYDFSEFRHLTAVDTLTNLFDTPGVRAIF